MATRYVSDSTENGYAIGADSGAGTTKAEPWLTANHALDNAADGDTIVFNNGTYAYTNDNGRKIFAHEAITINGETEYGATLVFSGSGSQGLRLNGSDTETRTLTLGKINIETAGDAKTSTVYISGVSSNMMITIDTEAKFTNIESVSGASIISLFCKNVTLNMYGESGFYGSSEDINNGCVYAPNLEDSSVINITACDLAISAIYTSGRGPITLKWIEACPTSTCLVSGVTGYATDISADSGISYAIIVTNGPEGTEIVDNNNLRYSCTNAYRSGALFSIQSPGAQLLSCNDAIIARNKNCILSAANGYLIAFGADGGESHNCANGIIADNDVSGVAGVFTGLHGICHMKGTSGIRTRNKVRNASIGSLTKRSTATSTGNEYSYIGGSSNVFLYAKGASAGSVFAHEVCKVTPAFTGLIEQALYDSSGENELSEAVTFAGTIVSGQVASTAKYHLTGSSTDASTSTSFGMTITAGTMSPTVVASIGGTDYATIDDANAAASIVYMRSGYVNQTASYGLTFPLTSPLVSR